MAEKQGEIVFSSDSQFYDGDEEGAVVILPWKDYFKPKTIT